MGRKPLRHISPAGGSRELTVYLVGNKDIKGPENLEIEREVCGLKLSARNVIKGKVKEVTPGMVNTEVKVELTGGSEIVAIITKTSAESLGLEAGKEVYAVIKASNVIIAAD